MGKIAEQANIAKLDEAMGRKKEHLKEIYGNVLRVLKLKVRAMELVFELVRSLAQKELKTEADKLGLMISVDEYEGLLMRYVPWKFAPKENERRGQWSTARGGYVTRRGFNLSTLQGQLKALKTSIDAIESIDDQKGEESGEPTDT